MFLVTLFPEELFITPLREDNWKLCIWNFPRLCPMNLFLWLILMCTFTVLNGNLTVSITAFGSSVSPSRELSELKVVLENPKLAIVRSKGGLGNPEVFIWYLTNGGLVDCFPTSKYNMFYSKNVFSVVWGYFCIIWVFKFSFFMFSTIFTYFLSKCF